MKAGYCSECAANVWIGEDGGCAKGHPASVISNVYDVEAPAAPAAPSVRKEIPRWAAALWGAVLLALNLFMVVYLAGFTLVFTSVSGGPSGPSWLSGLFFDERAFGGLFVVVGIAVMLSFAAMALSLLHIFAWSGLAMDRKLVWAAVVFAGAQPGMLIYWFMNVWRRERETTQKPISPETPLRRAGIAALGILTILPMLYFVFFFVAVGGLAASGSSEPGVFEYLPTMHLGVMLLWWVLTAIYLVHVFRTPRLVGNMKAIWAALIAFGGPIAWPVYWYLNMWRRVDLPARQYAQ